MYHGSPTTQQIRASAHLAVTELVPAMGHSKCNPAPVSLNTDVEIQLHGNDQGNSVSQTQRGKFYSWSSIPSIICIKIHALKKKKKNKEGADFISSLYPSACLPYLVFFQITLLFCLFLVHLTTFPNQQSLSKLKALS